VVVAYYPSICLEGLRNPTKVFDHQLEILARGLQSRVLPTRPSVPETCRKDINVSRHTYFHDVKCLQARLISFIRNIKK
jgi:hypothetical protein